LRVAAIPTSKTVFGSDVRIKICGLTQVDEALACLNAGADWIGLNFHARSPRFVGLSRAREMMAALPRPSQAVGLFVDRPAEEVASVARSLGLNAVQLHGNGPPQDLVVLGDLWIIRAFRLGNAADVRRMSDYLIQASELGRSPDAVLVDALIPGQAGGTGTLVANDILSLIPPLPHLILAGGLTPGNVAERIERVGPWMVDVASGVETSPGRKDLHKVRAFISAVRPSNPV
jgi:phosphoribosylanthranilate isomerase